MKLIVLPGNSKSNKEWSEEAVRVFSGIFSNEYTQEYSHWQEEKGVIDFDTESKRLVQNITEEEYCVIAKSAGAMLTIYCVSKNLVKPSKCVFFGLPLFWAKEYGFDLISWTKNYNVPTLIIQNSNDPMAPYSDVKKLIEDHLHIKNIRTIELKGNDHKYTDFENIKKEIESFYLN